MAGADAALRELTGVVGLAAAGAVNADPQIARAALWNATEALRCAWVVQAHETVEDAICGMVTSWALMWILLVLGALFFLMDHCHAATLAGVHWTQLKRQVVKPPKPKPLPTPEPDGPTPAEMAAKKLADAEARAKTDAARVKAAAQATPSVGSSVGLCGAIMDDLLSEAVLDGPSIVAGAQGPVKVSKVAWGPLAANPDIALQCAALGSTRTVQRYDR